MNRIAIVRVLGPWLGYAVGGSVLLGIWHGSGLGLAGILFIGLVCVWIVSAR